MFGFRSNELCVRSLDRGERARYAVAVNNRLIRKTIEGALQFKAEGFGLTPTSYLAPSSAFQRDWKKDTRYYSDSQYELYKKFDQDIDSIRHFLEFTLWEVKPELKARHIAGCYGRIVEIIDDMILIRDALGA